MKTVILAGGFGSRLGEETDIRPKPMVRIGDRPILWHIMKIYAAAGFDDFVICLGYKGYMIKEFFANYFLHTSDVTFDISRNSMEVHRCQGESWRVTLVDTGSATMTGGRLRNVRQYIPDDEPFCMTYGDGVADIDVQDVVAFHRDHGRLATLTAVTPPGRFGNLELKKDQSVHHFTEKPKGDGSYINGGFFVLSPKVFDYIDNDMTIWEQEPLRRLSEQDELKAYMHDGYWQCMDTIRDKNILEELWNSGRAPWKRW